MADKERLVEVIHRLASDEELRRQLMIAPREVLMAELGIPNEVYDALVGLAPVLLAGGLLVLGGGVSPDPDGLMQPDFGGWGKG